jgi:hypothetical protein
MAMDGRVDVVARRISDGIHDYAASAGWNRKDYRVYITVNSMWWRAKVVIHAKDHRPDDENDAVRTYNGISDAIEEALGTDSQYFNYTGLHIYNDRARAKQVAAPRDGNEFEISAHIINPAL